MSRRRVLILTKSDTEAALDIKALLDQVSRALIAISRGEVSAPPRIAARAPSGLIGAMPGYVSGMGMAAKLVSISNDHRPTDAPSHRGLVALFDERNGDLLAIINGAAITQLRTAASATLSMQHLATGHVGRVAVIGTGAQAYAQLRLLRAIGYAGPILVGSRDPKRGPELTHADALVQLTTTEDAVRNAAVIFCCSDARHPVLKRSWLTAGAHVSSIGGSKGPELDPATIAEGATFVEWLGAVDQPPPAGAHELQGMAQAEVTLLGSVIDNKHPGRTQTRQLTVFKSTGHAALDVAAATVAYNSAREHGIGTVIDFEA